ncbi:methyltransferase domain-containing protein [Paraburkholderia tuberum]|uniref:Methyltransferase domain-containing protein n=1 Tax=Paraburkholderia tuberum TaxID=157910 RepID=A0A1H1F4G9_9BURK|nr:methyltransferase domain-containing protein [Paraburkholderia tuberum]SDQ95306.1 Methyltransferase domain-containing protein [Paraburkholderia tuberum]
MAKEDNALSIDEIRDKRRCRLLKGLNVKESVGVEIGPLCWPLVRRSDAGEIIYVDHTDTPHLRQKYKDDPHLDVNEIVDVDAVWGRNTLHEAIRGRYVDYVVASHVVEHVPDLVTWLGELGAVLKPTGEVRLVVPDRRYTFDYFRRESRLPEVLASYIARARVPQPYSLLDHCLSAADVSTQEAWQKRIDPQSVRRHHTWQGALHLARDAFENGTYHDVHCWVFTPRSFAKLIADLCEMKLIDFACEDFCDTMRNDIEFSVVMRRSRDSQYIAESWRRMERQASDITPAVPFWRTHRKLRELCSGQDAGKSPQRVCGQRSELDSDTAIKLPPGFNEQEYLAANTDVAAAGVNAGQHYLQYGWREGRALRPAPEAQAAPAPVAIEAR